jgi:hypothetical protein
MGMVIVDRWWNRRWGSLARRDVHLATVDGGWCVLHIEGGLDSSRIQSWDFPSEDLARAKVSELTGEFVGWFHFKSGSA